MAYLSFPELGGIAAVRARVPGPTVDPVPAPDPVPASADRLTSLEWSVVRIARRDGLGSLRQPGRVTNLLRAVLRRPNPMLADARLEALRRMAVLSWQYGYTVPSREVRMLFEAGFTPRQYETLVDSINRAKTVLPRTMTA